MRIVSLLPATTEILCALGLEERLVGRSHECDYPESIRHLPVCTEPKFPLDDASAAVDRRIKTLVREGLSVYRVDADQLRSLNPQLVLTQNQCAACAADERQVADALYLWVDARPAMLSMSAQSLGDVWTDVTRIAAAAGAPERGAAMVARLTARIDAIAARARAIPVQSTVACIEWLDPMMGAGNWMPELVRAAGGVSLFGIAGQHSPWLHWASLVEQDPDIICLMPCGFTIDRTKKELEPLTTRPEWPRLKAVRERRVYLADGSAYFNRPGPRLVESVEMLAEMIHPTVFRFGHAGSGWERLD